MDDTSELHDENADRRKLGRRTTDQTKLTARKLNKILVVSVMILVVMCGTLAFVAYTAVRNSEIASYNQGVNLYLNCYTLWIMRNYAVMEKPSFCKEYKFPEAEGQKIDGVDSRLVPKGTK